MKNIKFIKPPIPNHRGINPGQYRKYHKNLDIQKYDSYFTTKNTFKIQFPVNEEGINVKGVHYYNMFFGEILVIHISNISATEIRNGNKVKMVSIDILEENLETIYNGFDLKKSDNIHVFVYNNDKYPGLPFLSEFRENEKNYTNAVRPNENGGGGVIIVGP
jgi:hypothetical protein